MSTLEKEPLITKWGKGHHLRSTQFNEKVSQVLDIWKGIFIFFMLTEHTRSSLSIGMTVTQHPWMHVISQIACALDMTTFSTAYGFSCWRSYLDPSVKNRSTYDTTVRILRSVGLCYAVGVVLNILFATQVLGQEPSLTMVIELASLSTVYWDFILTFPLLLCVGLVTTGPILRWCKDKSTSIKLTVFGLSLLWPLLFAQNAFNIPGKSGIADAVFSCETKFGRYAALLLGCYPQTFESTRFPALPYMFFFNLGCIASLVLLEYAESLDEMGTPEGAVTASEASETSSDTEAPVSNRFTPYVYAFLSLVAIEFAFAVPLILNSKEDQWEELDKSYGPFKYRRFPMSFALELGWAFLSLVALCLGIVIYLYVPIFAKLLERFGARVLLFFTMNAIIIDGFFKQKWHKKAESADERNAWEITAIGVSVFTIITTELISYLVISSRK